MTAIPTEKEFSQHINTKYRLNNVDTPQPIELELIEVKPYANKDKPGEQAEMERFSVYFQGPAEIFLPQQIYSLAHEKMGNLELFLVPIARDDRGFRYESVFNYHIKREQ